MSKTHKLPKKKPYALKNYKGTHNVLGGSGEYWNKIAQKSEAKFRAKDIQPLPDYDTFTDGWRER